MNRREERKSLVRVHNEALMFQRTTAIEDQLTAQLLPDIQSKGWTNIPVTYPFIDVPIIMQYLDEHGWLDRITFALIPSENPPGTWECLITSVALAVTGISTKAPPEVDVSEMDMEPPVPEVDAVTAETRFPDHPNRCGQCDHFTAAARAGLSEALEGCEPLGEVIKTAFVCKAFVRVAMSHLTHYEVI